MRIRLSFNGHESPRVVEVSDVEYAEIQRLTETSYLFDSERGRQIIREIQERPNLSEKIPTVICYI